MKLLVPALLLPAWLGFWPSPLRAEVTPANQAEAASAFQALDALARQTRTHGELPRWSRPDQARVLARIWDATATLGAPPYRSADIPALLTIGERAGAVYKTYLLFAPQTGSVPDTAANTLTFQDEITRAGAYLLQVQVAQLEAAADFVGTLPAEQMNETRRKGVRMMRLGAVQQVTGLALMLRSPELRPENRELLLDALGASAGKLTAATPITDRTAMKAQIDAVLPSLSAREREKAQMLASAFANQDCAGLCALE